MIQIQAVGIIHTPFSQKFGIPRQGLGLSIAKGRIKFEPTLDAKLACEGLLAFSHCWLLFQFHEHADKSWSERVRPPRLGGNQKIGVFATRSSFRPNGIGMSVVKVLGFEDNCLEVEGVDLLTGTPIIDIKPYIAYSDCINDADSAYAKDAPSASLEVKLEPSAEALLRIAAAEFADIKALVFNVISQDPRPAYKQHKRDEKAYSVRLYDYDISFSVVNTLATVHKVEKYTDK
ncbi:tRNA (N6-threonylcarbamoyladenosine(37)-N6)-methyltransferase TrmO [Ningiella sp. W23]|uniref:tRNA (N6-threonylcarbamoyladenosine(37)-N6)-methyltransferase TrmO n=1 Tax=Ningiella sp. W23 TaxID=3023715 RepID=UPI003757A77A